MSRMFSKILIANRGEIACRVMATCRRMGVATVAVYSEADAGARHVALADEAYPIGPAAARDSYLSIGAILDAAARSGAQAIHPGYGFLSENPAFAEACLEAGIVFIGPPAASMHAMGSKAAAKALMAQSGVKLVPGYHGEAQDFATLSAQAAGIGFPVLIKASAGGGGRGMRIVERADALQAAVDGAKREALASFGDARLLIETYLTRPRHIEIQVFADTLGNIVSLFERDCSIQRRHQKVVEEAPAPGMGADRRRAMGEAAIAAARAVGYVGAGTVEFIAEGDAFYFMEMNTRLQVEHPVTEFVTGQDLVEWQLRVAAGERLPLLQDELGIAGHAIEMRVYAEDPARDFLPSIGRISHLRQPAEGYGVRVDTGVRQGDAITPYYDAMVAKLIVWGADRDEAVRRLRAALAQYELAGVQSNLDLLRAIAAHPAFAAAALDTGFIARHADMLFAEPPAAGTAVLAAAVLAVRADWQAAWPAEAGDPYSPWGDADLWRMNVPGSEDLVLYEGERAIAVRVRPAQDGTVLDMPGGTVHAAGFEDADGFHLRLDGVARRLSVVREPGAVWVIEAGRNSRFGVADPWAAPQSAAAGGGTLVAPIPARVTRVLVQAGDVVGRGAPLLVLEAMKMEITLSAPVDGTIALVRYGLDEMVQEGAELVTFEQP